MKSVFMIFTFACLAIFTANATEKDVIGTWKFEADEAPYEYQNGKAVFFKKDNALMVKLVFDYNEINNIKVTKTKNSYEFELEVDYEQVPVVLELKEGKLTGFAKYGQGNIPVVMTAEKK